MMVSVADRLLVLGLFFTCQMPVAQPQICMFQHNLEADCYYRIDSVSLSHIEVEVERCYDPVEIKFKIENREPHIKWKHTFSKDSEEVYIPGFNVDVTLQVIIRHDDENRLWIQADFRADNNRGPLFMDEKLNLNVETCSTLNKAGKIAVACLVVLVIIAGTLTGVLLYFRHRRRKMNNHHQTLTESISISCSDLPTQSFDKKVPLSNPVVFIPPDALKSEKNNLAYVNGITVNECKS